PASSPSSLGWAAAAWRPLPLAAWASGPALGKASASAPSTEPSAMHRRRVPERQAAVDAIGANKRFKALLACPVRTRVRTWAPHVGARPLSRGSTTSDRSLHRTTVAQL